MGGDPQYGGCLSGLPGRARRGQPRHADQAGDERAPRACAGIRRALRRRRPVRSDRAFFGAGDADRHARQHGGERLRQPARRVQPVL